MKLSVALAASIIVAGLTGCRDEVATIPPLDSKTRQQAKALTSDDAWLNQRLPAETILYLRVPSLWGLLAAPKNRPLDSMRAHPAHLKAITELRDAWLKDPLWQQLQLPVLVELYLHSLASPLEVALISPGRIAGPASQGLLSARLTLTLAEFKTRLDTLVAKQQVELKTPLNAEGFAELKLGSLPSALHFSEKTGRLQLLIGLASSSSQLQQLEATPVKPLPGLAEAEKRLDDSGQGEFLWFDVDSIKALAHTSLKEPWLRLWLQPIKSLALSNGSQHGRGQLTLWVDAPQAKWLDYLPHQTKNLTLKTIGEPEWAMVAALPSADEFRQIQTALNRDSAEAASHWQQVLQQFQQYAGFDLPQLFETLGPEVLMFSDKAGDFVAVRLQKPKEFNELLTKLADKRGFRFETLKHNGQTYYHLTASFNLLPQQLTADAQPELANWCKLLERIQGHYYWIQEADHLIFASVPQSLRDRVNQREAGKALAPWLALQGMDAQHSLLSLTTKSRYLQRQLYYGYLGLLNLLADLSGKPLDLLSLPSARELQLPDESSIGGQFSVSAAGLGLSLNYTESPFELVSGSATTTIAAIGILSSIALPAYQDFQKRSQVSQALTQLQPVQDELSDHFAHRGKLPASLAETSLLPEQLELAAGQRIDYQNQQLVLYFGSDTSVSRLQEQVLVLRPYKTAEGGLGWLCGQHPLPEGARLLSEAAPLSVAEIEAKYLPARCR